MSPSGPSVSLSRYADGVFIMLETCGQPRHEDRSVYAHVSINQQFYSTSVNNGGEEHHAVDTHTVQYQL